MENWESKITHLRDINFNSHRRDDNDESDRIELEPYIIAEGVKIQEYLSRRENKLLGQGLKNSLAFVNGNVLIYELAISPAHEILARWFSAWKATSPLHQHFRDSGSCDLIVAPNIVRQPDGSFRPRGRLNPVQSPLLQADQDNSPFPTMVIEVGVSQSLQSLQDKAIDYLCATTDIQIVLCISLWPRRDHANRQYQMVALFYNRAHSVNLPQTVISFGTLPLHYTNRNTIRGWYPLPLPIAPLPVQGHVNAATQPTAANAIYTLQIPSASLFNGAVGGVPAGVPANIPLNLLDLRGELTGIQF